MYTKLFFCLAFFCSATTFLPGQAGLDWVLYEDGEGCAPLISDCANTGEQCYGLSYTPSLTGMATSYTLSFFSNCVDGGTAGLRGQSCTMTDNTEVQSACTDFNLIQLVTSGNSGSLPITAGQPVILHVVCMTLEPAQSMMFTVDGSLELTVSVDLSGGGAETDEPLFASFAATDACGNLPVTWEQFTAVQQGKTAQLDWRTSSETDHDYFTVEWGTDGRSFESLATVREAEWTQGPTASYGFMHETPATGPNYYRIRQTDFDGSYSFSNIELLTFSPNGDSAAFSLFPNPARETVRLDFEVNDGSRDIELLTMSGKLLRTVRLEDNQTEVDMLLGNLPAGAYLIRVEGEVRRLIKQ